MVLGLSWQAWYTAGVVVVMGVALARNIARPDLILLGSLGLLLVAGVLPAEQAFSGFSNPAVLTIASLFVVAAGVERTEALLVLDKVLFPARNKHLPIVLLRMMGSIAAISAFVNNTPLVAMLVPRVQAWSERHQVPASKLMMPLSFAAIVGGMVTLIGTSTNLVVSGVLLASTGQGLGFFDLTWVGLPVAVAAIVYLALFGHRLLPFHEAGARHRRATAGYCFEIRVKRGAPISGKTVEEADLRALGSAYLAQIRREERLIAPVGPDVILQGGDLLSFTGDPAAMDMLLHRPDFERSVTGLGTDGQFRLPLFEAVVAASSVLVGRTLREVGFRDQFRGVVLAIYRRNEEIKEALGSVRLQAGDLLVIEARNNFYERWKFSRDEFYLVSPLRGSTPTSRRRKAPIALALFVGMILVSVLGVMPLVTASFVAAMGMVATRCLYAKEARHEVDIPILLMIAAAIGIGEAIETSGLAQALASALTVVAHNSSLLVALIAIYVATNLLTEIITHSAAAVMITPIAIAIARSMDVDPVPFAVAVAIAASAGFMTPFGYQTNLMVMGAGQYQVRDYFKAGAPLKLLVMVVAVGVIWFLWM
ncbi:MAG TPA: SLC13 family permease [Rhodothermales bacterium]|nr:SLC13 family permease [Rhodothermales bacterium]